MIAISCRFHRFHDRKKTARKVVQLVFLLKGISTFFLLMMEHKMKYTKLIFVLSQSTSAKIVWHKQFLLLRAFQNLWRTSTSTFDTKLTSVREKHVSSLISVSLSAFFDFIFVWHFPLSFENV